MKTSCSVSFFLLFFVATSARATDYFLPFEDRWFVMAGGDTINVNHHMAERSQQFGVDFMKIGGPENRSVTKGEAKKVEDFYAWGATVLAPVAGVVSVVNNEAPDFPLGQRDREHAFGNYVVIEASSDEFVYLAHFQQGSIAVKVGQEIKAGQILGKCGNSGNTDGPHIHMHVQDKLAPYTGTGQVITFNSIDVLLSFKQFTNVDWPLIQGLFVEPHRSSHQR